MTTSQLVATCCSLYHARKEARTPYASRTHTVPSRCTRGRHPADRRDLPRLKHRDAPASSDSLPRRRRRYARRGDVASNGRESSSRTMRTRRDHTFEISKIQLLVFITVIITHQYQGTVTDLRRVPECLTTGRSLLQLALDPAKSRLSTHASIWHWSPMPQDACLQ